MGDNGVFLCADTPFSEADGGTHDEHHPCNCCDNRGLVSCAALGTECLCGRCAAYPIARSPEAGDVTICYDPNDGMVTVTARNDAPDGEGLISSLNLVSASPMFLPDNAAYHCSQFPNVCTPEKMFFLETSGVGKYPDWFTLGNILPPGLSFEQLLGDLAVSGSMLPRGDLSAYGGAVVLGCIPEPSASTLLLLGSLGLTTMRRRRCGP